MALAAKLLSRLRSHRRRLLPVLVVVFVVAVASKLSGAFPREVSLRYELGPEHAELTEARIGYRRDGEEIQSVRFAYADGAPSVVSHRVSLPPGHYDVVADVVEIDATRSFVRSFEVPADGVVRVRLFEDAIRGTAP